MFINLTPGVPLSFEGEGLGAKVLNYSKRLSGAQISITERGIHLPKQYYIPTY
ncbi:unnamed protein product [marine sediment metagenome]|uniref:Uncharacterized protein n=1 Tax=marine sediment metagenome TaxID=412755 RepID=X1TRJ1_9ZZZZ